MTYFKKQFKYFFITSAMIYLLSTLSGCSSYRSNYGDDWFGRDKLYHFAASGLISAGTTAVANNNGASEHDAAVIGLSLTFSVGAGKEFYDLAFKETYWSWKDLFWNMIGGAFGCYAASK